MLSGGVGLVAVAVGVGSFVYGTPLRALTRAV